MSDIVKTFPHSPFELHAPYEPSGDQPQAIEELNEGLESGLAFQTLLGVTGSGKTFTMANVIARQGVPALIMAPNKTLAAQLYSEMREFFPNNAVEYFVSYYDYYQPEAYVPSRDLFIEKDSAINEHIEQMRLAATKSILERRDTIIVATVSAIYGIGKPESYTQMRLIMRTGDLKSRSDFISQLVRMQYKRSEMDFARGTFRVRGDTIDVFPAEHAEMAVRFELFDDELESIALFDPLTGKVVQKVTRFVIYPASHYVTPRDEIVRAIATIKEELRERKKFFLDEGKLVEAQRLEQRTLFDLEMLDQVGFCKGIENYSRHLTGLAPGVAPPCLIDYLPSDCLMFFDESHVMMGQLGGMYRGDRSRKETLVLYGFRLPSALDNRPLRFDEFERKMRRSIFVSATPADYELEHSSQVPDREALRKNKGNGFGLMNCKGIIEKYKKTNPVFNVCLFNVKSTLGQGSRFYFRLPAGVRKVLTVILLVFSLGMVSCSKATDNDVLKDTLTASLTLALQAEYELLLNKASDYANEAYYCNVDGEYALALQYIDSAMVCLNEHYGKYAEEPHRYMTLVGDDIPAELDWWNEMFNSDFHVILDIRNEAAVAFLALKQWDEYGYNNAAYTTLNKLLCEN